ncbi:MAG TPA: creatininase family protein [Armatimonadota bacterium]|nr:creatininase family protein [Armatimonadota bacterium]
MLLEGGLRVRRREFLKAMAAGTVLAARASAQATQEGPPMAADGPKVQWELMLPHEMKAALEACPTAFVPLGTLEWHGYQNALGLDALKAHALCVRAARQGGGIVLPPLYGGVGGVAEPYTVVMEPEPTFSSHLLEPWLRGILAELKRIGFRAAIVLTGHYGASQQIAVRETAVRESQRLAIPILGTPEYLLAMDAGYLGDHGGRFETSLLMALHPELVDLSRLEGPPPYRGIGGGDPKRESSADEGERVSKVIVDRLARLARHMPRWDDTTRTAFIRAEQALVSHQLELGGRAGDAWAAWHDARRYVPYGEWVAAERFAEIEAMARLP